jgi:hypothetical protein
MTCIGHAALMKLELRHAVGNATAATMLADATR